MGLAYCRRRFLLAVAASVLLVPIVTIASPAAALGPNAIRAGFNSTTYGGNDDGSYPCTSGDAGVPPSCTPTAIPLPFTINFYGTNYSSFFLNNNGNLTFDSPLSAFTPFPIAGTNHVMIAPYFADVDTRVGNTVTFGSGTVNGHSAFAVNWPGVGCFATTTSVLNYFQVVLIQRSDVGAGDFDVEFNYDQVQWEAGQASGGDGNCQGGSPARVGFSDGTGSASGSFELPGSGINGAFLDSNSSSGLVHNSINSGGQLGRYVFGIHNGHPSVGPPCTATLTGDQTGPFNVVSGAVLCLNQARVIGPVAVMSGGALIVTGSQITNGITSQGAVYFRVCDSKVSGGVSVAGSTGFVTLGTPFGCGPTPVAGPGISLTGNQTGVSLVGSNSASGITVNNNLGFTLVQGNTAYRNIDCSGNNPAPTNGGQTNTSVTGSKTGQCASL